jgi:hypothetical protein
VTKATDLVIIATAAASSRRLYTLDGSQAGLVRDAGVATTTLSTQ